MAKTRDQVKRRVPNPTGKGGFQERPQDRNAGTWDSKNSISFQYHRFMNMPEAEFRAFTSKPASERTMAERIAYNRVKAADKSLADVKEITDRIEGKAFQKMDITSDGEKLGLDPIRAEQLIRARANRGDL